MPRPQDAQRIEDGMRRAVKMGGYRDWEELPAGIFAVAGTNVRTVLLTAIQPASP